MYQFVQEFLRIVHSLQGEQLDAWIAKGATSQIKDLQQFAKGFERDKAAVLAGLTLSHNNGPTEGHVNRLKLIKRSMYGRAKLPRLASSCASYGRERGFSRSHPCWIVTCLTSPGEQVQEGRAGVGTEKANVGGRNCPRQTEARRTMSMSFDINEAVFDEQGTYLEEKAVRYEHALMDQFAASPEGQAITQTGTELGWAGAMIHYAIDYPGVTPPTMTAKRLEHKMQEPANFGMAKSFILMGKQAGFDMESPEGMQAWVEAYNATVAPAMAAAGPPSKKKSRGAPKGTRSAQRRNREPVYLSVKKA